jgi:4-hydroxybenzoyl-CoA thioesterase
MTRQFRTERTIRFAHCDTSGVVYFVRLYEFIDAAVEDWFAQALELPFETLQVQRRIGTPIVSNSCEFYKPLRLGERLALELSVRKLGRSSIEFEITGKVSGEARFQARHKIAMMSLDTYRSIEIPAEVRARVGEYLVHKG